jgi:hypothetical protein
MTEEGRVQENEKMKKEAQEKEENDRKFRKMIEDWREEQQERKIKDAREDADKYREERDKLLEEMLIRDELYGTLKLKLSCYEKSRKPGEIETKSQEKATQTSKDETYE